MFIGAAWDGKIRVLRTRILRDGWGADIGGARRDLRSGVRFFGCAVLCHFCRVIVWGAMSGASFVSQNHDEYLLVAFRQQ
jgi:hypothetical protein